MNRIQLKRYINKLIKQLEKQRDKIDTLIIFYESIINELNKPTKK